MWRGGDIDADLASSVDPREFARVLVQHRLALALPAANRLDSSVPAPLCAVLRARQRRMTLRTLRQTAALRELVQALDAAGMRYCLLKGQGYAALFDAPQRREGCDIGV